MKNPFLITLLILVVSVSGFSQSSTTNVDDLQMFKDGLLRDQNAAIVDSTYVMEQLQLPEPPKYIFRSYQPGTGLDKVYVANDQGIYHSGFRPTNPNNFFSRNNFDSFNPYGARDAGSALGLGVANYLIQKIKIKKDVKVMFTN
ncbi:MAG: hypothetical protein AAFX87_10005 [Bacteroidota bacterium]